MPWVKIIVSDCISLQKAIGTPCKWWIMLYHQCEHIFPFGTLTPIAQKGNTQHQPLPGSQFDCFGSSNHIRMLFQVHWSWLGQIRPHYSVIIWWKWRIWWIMFLAIRYWRSTKGRNSWLVLPRLVKSSRDFSSRLNICFDLTWLYLVTVKSLEVTQVDSSQPSQLFLNIYWKPASSIMYIDPSQ
jgi:hypothetical protein